MPRELELGSKPLTLVADVGGAADVSGGPIRLTLDRRGVRIDAPDGEVYLTWARFADWATGARKVQELAREEADLREQEQHVRVLIAKADRQHAATVASLRSGAAAAVCPQCSQAHLVPAAPDAEDPSAVEWERGYNDAMQSSQERVTSLAYLRGFARGRFAREILSEAAARQAPCVLPTTAEEFARYVNPASRPR